MSNPPQRACGPRGGLPVTSGMSGGQFRRVEEGRQAARTLNRRSVLLCSIKKGPVDGQR